MTPEERAEKIAEVLRNSTWTDDDVAFIASEIRQAAVEEALCDEDPTLASDFAEARNTAKAEAYEDAAKIAEECDESDWEYVAKRIRARAKALEGPNTSPSDTEAGK